MARQGALARKCSCGALLLTPASLNPVPLAFHPCSFSPLCIDAPTLKAGVAEGRRNIETVCRAVLGDVLYFSCFEGESAAPLASLAQQHGWYCRWACC